VAQFVGVLTNIVYVGIIGWVVFKLIDKVVGMRVDPKVELEGLDLPEMGVEGYAGIKMDKNSETPLSR
jgi:Amt family ammonium transporter